jgi:hypothetical protein
MTSESRHYSQSTDLGLSHGEYLLVWTWRRLMTGRGGCPLIAREFAQICDGDAVEVLATFCTFLQALACTSRRRLRVGYPGYPCLTTDERQLLSLIALAQTGDEEFFRAHLQWLAQPTLRPALALAARALGTALKTHGVSLPAPASVVALFGRRSAH